MAEQERGSVEGGKLYGFLGTFERTVDAKGRFSLPFAFRTDSPAQEEWVLTGGPDGTLCLYPRSEWTRKMDREARQPLTTQQRDQLRAVSEQTLQVRPDGQGRITLPLDRLGVQEIGETVAVVGMNHYLELWSPERLAATRAREAQPSESLLSRLFS